LFDFVFLRHATTEVHTSANEFDTKLVSQGEKFLFKLKSIETDVEERFQQAVERVANVQERVTDAHVAAIGKLEGLISTSNTTLSDRIDHADKRQSQLENCVNAGYERLEKLSNMESAKVLSEVRTLRTDVYRALKESAKTLADWQEEIRYAKTSSDEAKEDCRSMRSVIDTRFTQVLKPLHQVRFLHLNDIRKYGIDFLVNLHQYQSQIVFVFNVFIMSSHW
jgi:hypothetical protein